MSSEQPSTDLLFVVSSTDPGSKTLAANKKREVNRHAQINAAIKRKQTRQKNLQPPTARRFGDFVRKAEHEGSARLVQSSKGLEVVPLLQRQPLSPPIHPVPGPTKLDPFDQTLTPVTPHMESILNYYLMDLLPVIEPTPSERDDYTRWMLPLAAKEPVLMYSLIFCMSGSLDQAMEGGFGLTRLHSASKERALYKKHAFQALQQCFQNIETATQPSTLLAVHFLLWQEIFNGEEEVQPEVLYRLLELRQGLQGLQRKAMEGVVLGCFWRSIRTRTKPLPVLSAIQNETMITHQRLTEIISKCSDEVASLGGGLLRPEIAMHLDEEMLQLLHDGRVAWICFEQIGIQECTRAETRQFTIDRSNVDYRFLAYPFDHFHQYQPIQEAIRRAFIVFSNAHYNVIHPSSKIGRCLVTDLKDALEATDLRACWADAAEALLWCLFHGAHMSFGQPERPWFVNCLARVTSYLRLYDWTSIRGVLIHYYYMDRVFRSSFVRIFEEVKIISSLV